jgi:N-6 DNA Methylase
MSMATDPEYRWHQEWLGFLQPEGLVVSPPALCAAQAHVNRNIAPTQQVLIDLVRREKVSAGSDRRRAEQAVIPNVCDFCVKFLGWQESDLVGASGQTPIPESLHVGLSEYGETLKPDYAVPDSDNQSNWLLLIKTAETGTDFDAAEKRDGHQWHASAQARFERLLRETEVPVGLLCNGTHIRLVYAPRGESSGYLTFPVQAMCEVAGRPIVAALHMLLSADRLFTVPAAQRLPAILRESRKYQNEVSTTLAEQVLAALNELLRGFQAANEAAQGDLLKEARQKDPNHIYGGLLGSLMRMVFILYAEDRGLLPLDPVFVNNYSVAGLFQRLREDNARFPDTMDQRYGAWAQLLTLFRLIFDGAAHGSIRLPARHGKLFDPDTYPFLEGRQYRSRRQLEDILKPPRVSDGVIYRILSNLLLLDGERLSYRTLDVEQIGSVYEVMMGYELEVASGPSVGLRPDNVVVNLEGVLNAEGDNRAKLIREIAGCEITGQALEQLKAAKSTDDLLPALGKKISGHSTYVVPKGGMFLQPTDERRRSGSDYTPRSLTEPIVRKTLDPIVKRLGEHPGPQQILDLKICDPAMGSGAFLVEACRFLGDRLVEAWNYYKELPTIPPDEDPSLHARRLVAQRCLYGVDVNRFAVDLAKLSLWLATLAKEHPFTFLDHALCHGDSLVGFDRLQIGQFHWDKSRPHDRVFGQEHLEKTIERVMAYRREILEMAQDTVASTLVKQQKLDLSDQALQNIRRAGDLLVAAFFNASKDKERARLRADYRDLSLSGSRGSLADLQKETAVVDELRSGKMPIVPFHWEIEFPEVFVRANPGFDAFVGNPPFGGKNTVINSHREGYLPYLQTVHQQSHGNADFVCHFFRRSFELVRKDGTFGLIATNTIAQGDTRETGLRWICTHGGAIYAARKRVKWPGSAAVVVSVVHVTKGCPVAPFDLDGRKVPLITAFLFHAGGNESPAVLHANASVSFQGSILLGMGFTFDDTDTKGVASPIQLMRELISKDGRNADQILPYIGGEEVNDHPTCAHHRFAITFADWPLRRANLGESWCLANDKKRAAWIRVGIMPEDYPDPVAADYPDLLQIVEARVASVRQTDNRELYRRYWWQYAEKRPGLYTAIKGMERVLALSRVGQQCAFAFLPTKMIYADSLIIFAFDTFRALGILQSRVHEIWARFFSSSMKDDLRYTPTDCFETFPLPSEFKHLSDLDRIGRDYHEFRAGLMVQNNEGLTKTYNRFHDPNERAQEIQELRDLHAAMDRIVLDSYGWTDIHPSCAFLLDYDDEEHVEENGQRLRKKPWRYRWPDEVRDEVLARLLELNRQRALEQGIAAEPAPTTTGTRPPRRRARRDPPTNQEPLMPGLMGEEKQ